MNMKSNRKNRFKRNRSAGRSAWRRRAAFLAKVAAVVTILLTTSGALIMAHDFFTQTGHFRARQLTVSGQQRLTREQVLEIAGVDPQSNILSVNLAVARKRLLADAWIAAATVRREIPSGLHIDIREETPLAIVRLAEGPDVLINTTGRAFAKAIHGNGPALPTVLGLDAADLPLADKPASQPFKAAMELLKLAGNKQCPLAHMGLERIVMDPDIGATLHTRKGGRIVKLGFGHYREKCDILERVVTRLKRDDRMSPYRVVDLFDLNRIVVSLPPADSGDPGPEEVNRARS
jgi:cell division protein FtsQ